MGVVMAALISGEGPRETATVTLMVARGTRQPPPWRLASASV